MKVRQAKRRTLARMLDTEVVQLCVMVDNSTLGEHPEALKRAIERLRLAAPNLLRAAVRAAERFH
jgi:energy-converting hydrogenase A subunit M